MYKSIFAILLTLSALGAVSYLNQGKGGRVLPKLTSEIDAAWIMWKQTHGKSYGVSSDESFRKSIFTTNFQYIKKFNAESRAKHGDSPSTPILGLNQFSDLSTEEFKAH